MRSFIVIAASKHSPWRHAQRQAPGAAAEPVAQSGEFLFLGEQLPPGGEPVLGRSDFMTCTIASRVIGYLYCGCQPLAPSGNRSKRCRIVQKSSPHRSWETRQIVCPRLRNTDNPLLHRNYSLVREFRLVVPGC